MMIAAAIKTILAAMKVIPIVGENRVVLMKPIGLAA
jgi:hypothetical protein